MKLSCVRAHHPRHLRDLTPVQHAQVTAALEIYDGGGLTLEERFAEEQGAIDINLTIRELVGDGVALDAVSFAEIDGSVFVAGTTELAVIDELLAKALTATAASVSARLSSSTAR
jgi:hypothetical protein